MTNMTIRTFEWKPSRRDERSNIHHAVVTRGRAGAIITAEWDGDVRIVTAIERFKYEIEPIAARVLVLRAEDPTCNGIVDAEHLGSALWEPLGRPARPWRLYSKHGPERAALTDSLLLGMARNTFRFAPGAGESGAMEKALLSVTRDHKEDGPGSELAVALSLAIDDQRPPLPRIA